MIDTVGESVVPTVRRRRRLWITLSLVAAVAVAGVITMVSVCFHYLHAPALQAGGGFGWLPPDSQHSRSVVVGPYRGMVTPARPGHAQTFFVDVYNPASVTQTVLGLAYDTSETAEPKHLTVSTVSTAVGDAMLAHYTSAPVAIPPHGVWTLRLTRHTAGCAVWGPGQGRSEAYTGLRLRVRVGVFTRTESLDFGGEVFELRGTWPACPG